MSDRSTIVHVDVDTTTRTQMTLDLATLAEVFCHLSDDEMARFFVEVAKRAEAWPNGPSGMWWATGRHLDRCECSTDEARRMIEEIHSAMTYAHRTAMRQTEQLIQEIA